MSLTRAVAGNNPTPDVLDQGEKATAALLANLDTPPPNVTADQWKGARTPVEILGHSTLGWISMQRKSWDAAEGEFQKSLQLDPNEGEVDYFMGTVIASEKNPQKMSAALFYFARAATYEGTGGLAPAGRQQVLDYVKRAYKGYHGSDDGFNDLLAAAKAQPAPPAGYHIQTAGEIALAQQQDQQKKEADEAASHPELVLWKNIKTQLTGPDGATYFSSSMKDAQLPTLKGKVVKLEPELKPKTVVLALEDGTTPDATLKFEMPLAGKVEPGTELSFEGVPASYTATPYMVVFKWSPTNCMAGPARTLPPAHHAAPHKKLRRATNRSLRAFAKSVGECPDLLNLFGGGGLSNPLPTKNARSPRQMSAAKPRSVIRPGAPVLPNASSRRSTKSHKAVALQDEMGSDLRGDNLDPCRDQLLENFDHILFFKNRSHLISAEILVVQAFEPAALFLVTDFVGGGIGPLGTLQHGLIDVDGAIQAQRQRQGIAWPGVYANQIAILIEPDHGVEGIVLQFADHYFADAGSQTQQQRLDQIVRHGPWRRNFFDLEGNCIGLVYADPDWQNGIPIQILQHHDWHVGDGIHHQSADFHFDFHTAPLSFQTKYRAQRSGPR